MFEDKCNKLLGEEVERGESVEGGCKRMRRKYSGEEMATEGGNRRKKKGEDRSRGGKRRREVLAEGGRQKNSRNLESKEKVKLNEGKQITG